MNAIDYMQFKIWQITSNYMKKCNRLQLITITNYDYLMSVSRGEGLVHSVLREDCPRTIIASDWIKLNQLQKIFKIIFMS